VGIAKIMHQQHFQFSQRPFLASPDAECYFAGGSIEEARAALSGGIDRAAGPGLLIGPAGVGKTLLCERLAKDYQDRFHVALLTSARLCTRRSLLQAILFELGQPYQGLEEGELRLSLIDFLSPSRECPHGMLLVVDEAHTLPLRLLEELRMLTNLVRDGQPRAQVVLAGGPQLEERFTHPSLESFQQRIAVRTDLAPLSREATLAYVHHQLALAGRDGSEVFRPDALEAVYVASAGVPRLVNQVCDRALAQAIEKGASTIDGQAIQEAWSDLQQLPTPLNLESHPAAGAESEAEHDSGLIEFGELVDDAAPAAAETADALPLEPTVEPKKTPEIVALRQVEPSPSIAESVIEFAPLADDSPNASEPNVQETVNPFAEPFAEEEIIIDRYAALEDGALRGRTRVSGPESREIAAALAASETPWPRLQVATGAPAEPVAEPAQREAPVAAEESNAILEFPSRGEAEPTNPLPTPAETDLPNDEQFDAPEEDAPEKFIYPAPLNEGGEMSLVADWDLPPAAPFEPTLTAGAIACRRESADMQVTAAAAGGSGSQTDAVVADDLPAEIGAIVGIDVPTFADLPKAREPKPPLESPPAEPFHKKALGETTDLSLDGPTGSESEDKDDLARRPQPAELQAAATNDDDEHAPEHASQADDNTESPRIDDRDILIVEQPRIDSADEHGQARGNTQPRRYEQIFARLKSG